MKGFPIIVSYPLTMFELKPMIEDLEKKGYKVMLKKYNGRRSKERFRQLLFVLYRSISDKEKLEIADNKWKIENNSFKKISTYKLEKQEVKCKCPRCGFMFIGYDCDPRTFCDECKEIAGLINEEVDLFNV